MNHDALNKHLYPVLSNSLWQINIENVLFYYKSIEGNSNFYLEGLTLKMGTIKLNSCKVLKIIFIIGLLVRLRISQN